jgi:hypothetical protein
MAACEVCGTNLTAFNHAIGTNKCSGCSRGTSAAAQQLAAFQAFDRAPGLTERHILEAPISVSAARLTLAGAAFAIIGGLGGFFLEHEMRAKGMSFTLAIALGGAVGTWIMHTSGHPLDRLRWRAFATGVALFAIATVVGGAAIKLPLMAVLVLALFAGIGGGFAATAITDSTNKRTLAQQFRAWQVARGQSPQ